MKSNRQQILEAYNEDLKNRSIESKQVKVGSFVENQITGERYKVEVVSNNFSEVKHYDKSGEARSYKNNLLNENATITWVGFTDEFGCKKVLPYGEDGVSIVKKSKVITETSKSHNSIMDAYNEVVCEDTNTEVNSRSTLIDYATKLAQQVYSGEEVEDETDETEETVKEALDLADMPDKKVIAAMVDNAIRVSNEDWRKAKQIIKMTFTGKIK